MSVNFSNILACGFQKSEISIINEYAVSHDLNLQENTYLYHEIFHDIKEDDILLIKINNQNDIKFIKRHKLHIYESFCIFCLEYDKRNLIYTYINHHNLPFFFSPIDINEVQKSFMRILTIRKRKDNFFKHISGLVCLNVEFEWKSCDVVISPLCSDITRIMEMGNYIHKNESDGITLALEEAFTNSIEHGNLELDSNLRPQSYNDSDEYEKLKLLRMNHEDYGKRLIKCRIFSNSDEMMIEIEDQGKGFDTVSFLKKINDTTPTRQEILTSSGKGIILINKYFQKITYDNNGRSIRLFKKRIPQGG
ncbi:MAG: ATP-binding protein [Spirochaetales bacterium]|nr:ATP-binding protein [Spirochaetales bacterium]